MRISILCPTRGRIKRARLMRDSALITAKRPRELEFIFYVDGDDRETIQKLYLLTRTSVETPTLCVQIIIHNEPMNLSEKWNVCWKYATGDIFMIAADDIVFRTQNWDQKVVDKFLEIPDRIAFIWPSDGHSRNFGTHGFVHRNWTDVLGYFTPPYFERRCADSWLNELAKLVERWIGLRDVLVEHMYWKYGKAEDDRTYQRQREKGFAYKEFWNSTGSERLKEAAKLKEFMEGFDENSSDKSA